MLCLMIVAAKSVLDRSSGVVDCLVDSYSYVCVVYLACDPAPIVLDHVRSQCVLISSLQFVNVFLQLPTVGSIRRAQYGSVATYQALWSSG